MPRGEKYATLNRRFHKRNWGHKLAMFFVHLNLDEHHKFIIVSWRSTRLTTSTACQTSSIKSSKNRRTHPRIIEKKAVEPAHGRTTDRGRPIAGWRQAWQSPDATRRPARDSKPLPKVMDDFPPLINSTCYGDVWLAHCHTLWHNETTKYFFSASYRRHSTARNDSFARVELHSGRSSLATYT